MPVDALRNNHGFSLIEALVASAILATGLLSLAQLLAFAATANAAAGRTTYATLLAAQKIEELRASSSSALEGADGDAPAPGFTRRWSVSALPSDPEHVVLIQVLVRASGGETRLIALMTRSLP